MTKIITTLGPASLNEETLGFFADHSVGIARLNFSHGTIEWHREAGKLAQKFDLDVLLDLPGPKLRLGELSESIQIETGSKLAIELAISDKAYPQNVNLNGEKFVLLSCAFDIAKFAKVGSDILVDDGKLSLKVTEVSQGKVLCDVIFGGIFKSRKSLNMPKTPIDLPFMGERDKTMLRALLSELKPKFVAPSFVKNVQDIIELKSFLTAVLNENNIQNYFPMICTKLEMAEAMGDESLDKIVKASDMVMIARGDLALETTPLHLAVPFLQEKIKKSCQANNKPFVVATQVLESMIESPAPTRAEVSDLYRAVVIDKADYVMLSGESASGQFPKLCVDLMHSMINHKESIKSVHTKEKRTRSNIIFLPNPIFNGVKNIFRNDSSKK